MKKIFSAVCAVCLCVFLGTALGHAQTKITEYKVGEYTVYVLPEDQMSGNIGMLINVKPDVVKKYFSGKSYPLYLNTFLIKGPKGSVLVDSGFGNQLFSHLKTLNIDPKDINTILLTHMHGDHIGGLLTKGKVNFPNATVWVAKKELDYWTNKDIQAKLPKVQQSGFKKAQQVAEAYKTKLRTFEPKELVEAQNLPHYSSDKEGLALMDGVRALAAYGHTPGHTAFFVGHGENALLLWGDIVHVASIQMPMPEVGMVFDVDPVVARKTRLQLLEFIAKHDIKVAGMHIGRPGASAVKKQEAGYKFESVQ